MSDIMSTLNNNRCVRCGGPSSRAILNWYCHTCGGRQNDLRPKSCDVTSATRDEAGMSTLAREVRARRLDAAAWEQLHVKVMNRDNITPMDDLYGKMATDIIRAAEAEIEELKKKNADLRAGDKSTLRDDTTYAGPLILIGIGVAIGMFSQIL